ncbi:hypothetical protein [Nitrosomonas aestuarii]|uniref:hypothetical protein n=1 Tax=Nitrosomonas aestuarii TaxID=52441 RepID=UPI000D301774|nr:hypothetical protein [Nitrosomonas aestuarii]PTN12723.1 hypothetical protein C8R11_103292 [Nitrosomonas aestuarii]
MINAKMVLIAVFSLCTLQTQVNAQQEYDKQRGQLLYSIHCISCHNTKIHWRDNKLAKDWYTLKEQVSRWQANLDLDWHVDDIADVTGYLNAVYYHYPVMLNNNLSDNDLSSPTTALQSDAITE